MALGSSEKLDLEEDLEFDADIDEDDFELDDDDSGATGVQSTSKRVRMIFSVMASPNRIDILRILNSKGPLTYSELKSLAGFKSKKESGKFAYHLRKLLRQSLVALNKSERRYTITNLGKLVLSLARQIEERSIIESGKMYVRTSHDSIEEFNSHKIIQSLVRESSMPLELAQKITEEVENRIYKYQTAYLTGSLIRELVNSVLLEHGHEEYRNKLARLGMPVFDVQDLLTNVDNVDNGVEHLLSNTGKFVFAEHLLTNILPKDVADSHLSGDLHIANPGLWSTLPDDVFINVKELIDDGLDLKGKLLGATRVNSAKSLDDIATLLSMTISLISKEASKEVIMDGLVPLLSKYSKNATDLEEKIIASFATSSTGVKFNETQTMMTFVMPLGSDQKTIKAILNAYYNHVKNTPRPRIGILINHDKGKISDVSGIVSDIISVGGHVMFAKKPCTLQGILKSNSKSAGPTTLKLESLSINLPRLALESNKDETYFRARLALLMKPAIAAMALRKKDVSDLTRRGINPVLASNTQYMQRSNVTLSVNLVGLYEAVYGILGFDEDKDGKATVLKVLETAVDIANKKGKELGVDISVCMSNSQGSERFVDLDGDKYGKNSIQKITEEKAYSQGIIFTEDELSSITAKSDKISMCNKITKTLNGGLLVTLNIGDESKSTEIKKSIEKATDVLSSFKPVKNMTICGTCGFKDENLKEKCPVCKSSYII